MPMQPTRYEHELDALRERRDKLLTALRSAAAFLRTVEWSNRTSEVNAEDVLVEVEAAIAKAEG